MLSLLFVLLLLVPPSSAWAQTPAPKEASEPVMKQLEAFRRGDFDTAYTFASSEIKQLFDRSAFEHMVKNGYPEIARSTFASVANSTMAPNGHAYLQIKIRGSNGNSIEAIYELILENSQWKINGVTAKPDPGLVFKPSPMGTPNTPLPSGRPDPLSPLGRAPAQDPLSPLGRG